MRTEHRCNLCNKLFITPSKLRDHQNRKIPCVINDVIQNNDKVICTYCNRSYVNKSSLWNHHKICKSKIQHDLQKKADAESKIQLELLKHERELEKQKEDNEDLRKYMMEMMDAFKQFMQKSSENIKICGTDNSSVTNNITNTVNNNLNITLNNYTTPTVPNISFEEIRDCRGLHRLLLQKLYFNNELPENHTIFPLNDGRRNPRDRCLAVYDNNAWKKLIGDLIPNTLSNVSEVAFKTGIKILRDNEQSFRDEYNAAGRPVEFKTRIANFKAREEVASLQEIFEMAVEFSPLVKRPNI